MKIVSTVLRVICPVNAPKIWNALQSSSTVNQQLGAHQPFLPSERAYLQAMAEAYSNLSSWDTRRQVLSVMAGVASFGPISEFTPAQDEIARFRISETWRKHAALWFRYIYVLRKRANSNLCDSVTFPERKCQVTFPSYLSQQISAVVPFRNVSANGFAVVCYIYQNTNARWFFEQQ